MAEDGGMAKWVGAVLPSAGKSGRRFQAIETMTIELRLSLSSHVFHFNHASAIVKYQCEFSDASRGGDFRRLGACEGTHKLLFSAISRTDAAVGGCGGGGGGDGVAGALKPAR